MKYIFKYKHLKVLLALFISFITLYSLLLAPYMSRWGVSKTESKAIMTGDKKAALISSTRGILINSPRPKVWQELIHLGADRKGFYSYSLIESLLGYTSKGEFDANAKMPIGRVIPSSLNPSDAIINYTWTVINVTPGHSFVLSKCMESNTRPARRCLPAMMMAGCF